MFSEPPNERGSENTSPIICINCLVFNSHKAPITLAAARLHRGAAGQRIQVIYNKPANNVKAPSRCGIQSGVNTGSRWPDWLLSWFPGHILFWFLP